MTWEDVTVGQFEKLMEYLKKPESDIIDHNCRIVSIMKNVEFDTLLSSDYLTVTLPLIIEMNFMNAEPKERFESFKYEMCGKTYCLTPCINKMKTGQYRDYTTAIGTIPHSYIDILSALLIPHGATYGDGTYDFDELKTVIRDNFKLVDALGISFFFLKTYESLSGAVQTYLMRKNRKLNGKNSNSSRMMKNISIITTNSKAGIK